MFCQFWVSVIKMVIKFSASCIFHQWHFCIETYICLCLKQRARFVQQTDAFWLWMSLGLEATSVSAFETAFTALSPSSQLCSMQVSEILFECHFTQSTCLCFAVCKPAWRQVTFVRNFVHLVSCGEVFWAGFYHNIMLYYAKSRQDWFLFYRGIYIGSDF